MISDLFQLVESWRYCRAEACGSAGYFSGFQIKWDLKSGGSVLFHGLFPEKLKFMSIIVMKHVSVQLE